MMDDLHRKILRTNRTYLVKNLGKVDDVLDSLWEMDIITESMVQDVKAEKTTICQVRALLDVLPKRGPFAFNTFCNVLAQKGYRDVAKHLNPTMNISGTAPLQPGAASNSSPAPTSIKPSPHPSKTSSSTSNNPYPQPMSVSKPGGKAGVQASGHRSPTTHSIPPSEPQPLPDPTLSGKGGVGGSQMGSSSYNAKLGRQMSREVAHPCAPSDEVPEDTIDFNILMKEELFGSAYFEMKIMDSLTTKWQLAQNIYPITNVSKGRALIINNRTFDDNDEVNLEERSTSDNDTFIISGVMKKLGFKVVTKSNLSANQLKYELTKEQERDQVDMFICVILSYGGEGTVVGNDGQELSIQDIVNTFSTTRCPSMKDKPKLFFIQACGSKLKDIQECQSPSDEGDGVGKIVTGLNKLDLGSASQHLGSASTNHVDTKARGGRGSVSDQLQLEDMRDILVAMATSPDQNEGKYSSEFLLGLSYILCNYGKSEHLIQLLNKVNRLKKDTSGQYQQLCEVKHSLSKSLYFMPGYAPDTANISEHEFPTSLQSFGDTKKVS